MGHVEGIGTVEEGGVKVPRASGQRQQLEPTWEDTPSLTKPWAAAALGMWGLSWPVCADVFYLDPNMSLLLFLMVHLYSAVSSSLWPHGL